MTDRVELLPADEFVALWNRAWSIEEVVAEVCERVGHVPKWAVLARAAALRKEGVELKRFLPRVG